MNGNRMGFLLAMLLACSASLAAGPRRIYIANDDHTDYLWSADADTYADVFVDMLDFHMTLADQTAANPPAFRNRFNADGSYWLWCYEHKKSPAEFERLIARLKDGTLSAPLNTLVSCYGGQPVEAVLRGMYYAGRLERRYGVRFGLAIAMENQTLPLGLASLFAGSGAKYSWRGVCGCASRLPNKLLGRRDHEIYWYTGHDGQRLLMKWHSLAPAGNKLIGGYAEAFDPVAAIAYLDADAEFLKRYRAPGAAEPYSVRGAFGFGWDALNRKTGQPYAANPKDYPQCEHFHVIAKAQSTAQRQVIVSNQEDFFRDFESHYGGQLPAQTVTFGNEWDLYSASMSHTSGRVKRAVEKLRAAELLATLVSLKDPAFMKRRAAGRDLAFNSLGLYWEHNWTADGPIPRAKRAAWQELQAAAVEAYVDTLHADAAARLGGLIRQAGEAKRFFVLNPLGWPRTDIADFAYGGPADIHVRDVTTRNDVPHQIISRNGAPHLRIIASEVPSAGYKVYEILAGPGAAPRDDGARVGGEGDGILENAAVKLTVDRDGAIRSFIDKRRGNTELAATIGDLKLNDIAPGSEEGDALVVESRGPVSVTLRARSAAGLRHSTAITLIRDSDRIEITNEISANFADVRHWAFGFALSDPSVRTEEIGAINLNKRKADGGDYANTLARYDYVTVNHFADITDGSGTRGVTLSNPDLAFARLGNSTATALDTKTPQINVLAGGQVDGRKLGIQDQNGARYFLQRFALRPHGGYDPVLAMKFAMEHQNPLVTGVVAGKDASDTSGYPASTYSLLSVSDPGVLLWAVKPAEEGIEKGVIVRLWNVSDQAAQTVVTFTPGIAAARQTTHIETDLQAVPVTGAGAMSTKFARQQIRTFRLEFPTAKQ